MQPSTLTLYLDHRLVKSRVKAQRLSPCRDLTNIKLDISNKCSYNAKNKGGNPE